MITHFEEFDSLEFSPHLFMDVVAPARTTGPFPGIVWVHGGGWHLQDRTARPDLRRHFAGSGFVMVSIDYRLAPRTTFPGQLHDVRSALRWLRQHHERFNIDPARIGIWGSSAGGHLAALAGVHSDRPLLPGESVSAFDSSVQAVVDGYGPAELTATVDLAAEPSDDEATHPEAGLLGGPVRNNLAAARSASPALQVKPGAPPFLIMHGTDDTLVPPDQSVRLFDALAATDNTATLYLIDGFGHGFLNPGGVMELGPGRTLDQGHLESDPDAPATVRSHGSTFGNEHPHASFDTIESFFRVHLKNDK